MSYRNWTYGHWIHLTPDNLFAEYTILTPLLPSNVSLWGFNLVTQFHDDSLCADLQELLLAEATYMPPNLATLTSRSTQLAALRTLRVAAVCHHTIIRVQEKLITCTLACRFKPSLLLSVPLLLLGYPHPLRFRLLFVTRPQWVMTSLLSHAFSFRQLSKLFNAINRPLLPFPPTGTSLWTCSPSFKSRIIMASMDVCFVGL
jgi:hypothetical protein